MLFSDECKFPLFLRLRLRLAEGLPRSGQNRILLVPTVCRSKLKIDSRGSGLRSGLRSERMLMRQLLSLHTFAINFAIPFTQRRGLQSLVALLAAETGNLVPRLSIKGKRKSTVNR